MSPNESTGRFGRHSACPEFTEDNFCYLWLMSPSCRCSDLGMAMRISTRAMLSADKVDATFTAAPLTLTSFPGTLARRGMRFQSIRRF